MSITILIKCQHFLEIILSKRLCLEEYNGTPRSCPKLTESIRNILDHLLSSWCLGMYTMCHALNSYSGTVHGTPGWALHCFGISTTIPKLFLYGKSHYKHVMFWQPRPEFQASWWSLLLTRESRAEWSVHTHLLMLSASAQVCSCDVTRWHGSLFSVIW
jgi:hypothetical protein